MIPTPVYADPLVTLFHGDCRDILPHLPDVALLLTDPPYGMGLETDNRARGRSARAMANDHPPVRGDDAPFDPAHLLGYRKAILFGANYYADRLPPSGSWIVWDKLAGLKSERDVGFNDNADAELAWTNLGGPVRTCSIRWMGMIKQGEERDQPRLHPTQKPVALMAWCLARAGHGPGRGPVCDPYVGSGATILACRRRGIPSVGIDLELGWIETTIARLAAEPLPLFAL